MQPDMDQILEELEEAVAYEGSEVGECWGGLCDMWSVAHDGCSEEFIIQLEHEIREQYAWFKKNFKWIECKNCECSHCGRGGSYYRELVWDGD